MRNIRRRLNELSKSFPPLKDTGPELLRAAALKHLSAQDLVLLRDVNTKQNSSPVRPPSEPESQALEAYYSALALESRQARIISNKQPRYASVTKAAK
jgi:hypothetical protein